jgi:hypothetical protein
MIPPINLINKEGRLGITEETWSYLAQSKFVNTKQETMNTQLINQIKELPGVKEVTLVNDMAVVVFEPRKPVLTTDDGVDIFDGDIYWIVDKITYRSNTIKAIAGMSLNLDCYRFSTPESAKKWIDEQKKPKPIYTDPEDGTEFFEGDEVWWFTKNDYQVRDNRIENIYQLESSLYCSKIYKSRQLCELALAKVIMDKYK